MKQAPPFFFIFLHFFKGMGGSSSRPNLMDEVDDVVILENSDIEEEDVKEDESDHNENEYTFKDDDNDGEFDDLD
ncbi:hypothetical protein Tco_1271957 [Tanacetum coccineum]